MQYYKNNEVDKNNQNEGNEEDENYNYLFNSNIDIKSIKSLDNISYKSTDLSLDKELEQSKKNIIISSVKKDFLENRNWNDFKKDKIKNIPKTELKKLKKSIEDCNLEYLYKDFNPREVIYRIGTLSSLDFLIETTYHSDPNYINNMFTDKTQLEKYIYKFRSILGDGDCFYRSLIFSFLENIILTNNITLMKEFIILFEKKINIENPLIKKKEYLKDIGNIRIKFILKILNILYEYMSQKNENTYIVLLKLFLYCQDFDSGIIYFTRYLLYEYISSNENKLFSKENQIDIGCLLPEQFVIDKGNKSEYLFEDFYCLQLMTPKTFAEKIVIYIAPYVFNCNINILVYDYGDKPYIKEKIINTGKTPIFTINLLFRKKHYDIYYKKDFYQKYIKKLDCLPNILEKISYLKYKKPEDALNKYKENIKNNNLTNIQKDENYTNIFASQIYEKGDNSPKCLQCKKSYNNKENVFGLCNECLLNDLKTEILQKYILYLQKNDERTNLERLQQFFESQTCSISIQENISLLTAISNSGYEFKNLLLEIRKTICLKCCNNIEKDKIFIELPCECIICSKRCFEEYLKIIYKKLEIIKTKGGDMGFYSLNCYCGFKYDFKALIFMVKKLQEKKLKACKEFYQELIINYWKWKCMNCQRSYNYKEKFYIISFKDEKIDKTLLKNTTEYKHLICDECAEKLKLKNSKNSVIECKFCKYYHILSGYKEVKKDYADSNCIII